MARNWNVWPCTHQCTQFFRIAREEVERLLPSELVPYAKVDKAGYASFEVGYSCFPAGKEGLPASNELSLAVQLRPEKLLRLAVFQLNIAADNQPFLDHTLEIDRYRVYTPPVKFVVDHRKREFIVSDARGGLIAALQHRVKGSIFLPCLPLVTEAWSQLPGQPLQRRLFKWRGAAYYHVAPFVGSILMPHPFFAGLDVSRAEPIATEVFASREFASGSAQLLTSPEAARPRS
jgi:hypothetical protein